MRTIVVGAGPVGLFCGLSSGQERPSGAGRGSRPAPPASGAVAHAEG